MASVAAPRSLAMGRRVAPCPEAEAPLEIKDAAASSLGGEPDGSPRSAPSVPDALPDSAERLDLGDGAPSDDVAGVEGAGEAPGGEEEGAAEGPACEARVHLSAAALVDGGMQELEADSCSVCLEAFSESDPATLTMCNHEFHFQCILEWAQRKEECPMCWQALQLSDPASQDLLEVCARERRDRAAAAAALEAQAQLAPIMAPRIVFIRTSAGTRAGHPLAGPRHRPASTWAPRPAAQWHGRAAAPPQAAAPSGRSVSTFFSGDRSRGRGHTAGAPGGASDPAQPGAGASAGAHAGGAPGDATHVWFWKSSKSSARGVPSSSSREADSALTPATGEGSAPGGSSSRDAVEPTLVSAEDAAPVLETAPVGTTLSTSSRSSLSPPLSLASSPDSHQALGEEGPALSTDVCSPRGVLLSAREPGPQEVAEEGAEAAEGQAPCPGLSAPAAQDGKKQQNAAAPTNGPSASSAMMQTSSPGRSATHQSSSPAASWRSRFSLRSARSTERANP